MFFNLELLYSFMSIFLIYILKVIHIHRSGVARQLVTFFVSPKKVTQKRRPRCHWPSASQLCKTKNGKALKLASLRQQGFLYPFSILHNWQCQKWNCVKVKCNYNYNPNFKTISNDGQAIF